VAPVPSFVNVREYVPPGTSKLVQQFSLLAAQRVRPLPPALQLVPAAVRPVQAPALHVPVAHGQGASQCPVAAQVCTAEALSHCAAPGVQPAASPPLPAPALTAVEPALELESPEAEPAALLLEPPAADPEPAPPSDALAAAAPELPATVLDPNPALPGDGFEGCAVPHAAASSG
jgi:hypothetical protein